MTNTVINKKGGPRPKNRRSSASAPPCSHYTGGAAQLKLILRLTRSGSDLIPSSCAHCRADHRREKSLGFLWVCLDCSITFCGGVRMGANPFEPFGHARLHYAKDKHPWAIRRDDPRVSWCYICCSSASTSSIEMPPPPPPMLQGMEEEEDEVEEVEEVEEEKAIDDDPGYVEEEEEEEGVEWEKAVDYDPGYVLRGMVNTGNTCFFNAVLQNLLPIDSLRQCLYRAVGGPDRPITAALRDLFLETSPFAETSGVIMPIALLVQISVMYTQFVGRQQQDSHELLRCLLSGLEAEGTVVDDIFAGGMTSTVCCKDCGHVSVVHDPFLDLSLSLPSKRTPKKAAPPPTWKGTMSRKSIKRKLILRFIDDSAQCGSNSQLKDCSDDGLVVSSQLKNSCRSLIPVPCTVDSSVILLPCKDSDYKSTKWLNAVGEGIDVVPRSGGGSGLNQDEVDNTNSSVRCPDMDSRIKDFSADLDIYSEPRWEENACRALIPLPWLDDNGAILHPHGGWVGMSAEWLNTASPSRETPQNVASVDAPVEAANMQQVTPGPKTENAVGEEMALAGSSDSCQDEVDNTDSLVSINSCLELFTKEEFLSEEAWRCEHCPKNDLDGVGRDGVKSTARKIKRGATKRILIDRIPPILTIHLKRFLQEDIDHLTKLNGHVDFSEELDLRPYMDPRSLDKDKCQYRLTGVVVHLGSLYTGHYIAYVRIEKGQGKKERSSSPAWFYVSDAFVREALLSEVLSSEAYILFYERVQT